MKRFLFILLILGSMFSISAYSEVVKCGYCGGGGVIFGAYTSQQCPYCNGTGRVVVESQNSGRTVNGYIRDGRKYTYFADVTYFSSGVAVVSHYENQNLKVYRSNVEGFDYYVILTLPNYQTLAIYFRK